LACIKKEKLQPDWKTYEPILSCLRQLELWETYIEFYAEVLAQGYSLTWNLLNSLHLRFFSHCCEQKDVTECHQVTAYEALGMKSEALLAEARLQGLRKESKAAVRGDDKRLRSSLPH
jgi:hypothetical protein